jgi:hypothetical protein
MIAGENERVVLRTSTELTGHWSSSWSYGLLITVDIIVLDMLVRMKAVARNERRTLLEVILSDSESRVRVKVFVEMTQEGLGAKRQ